MNPVSWNFSMLLETGNFVNNPEIGASLETSGLEEDERDAKRVIHSNEFHGAEPFLRRWCQSCSYSRISQQFITVFTRSLHWSLS
jgi:hypothetical protein